MLGFGWGRVVFILGSMSGFIWVRFGVLFGCCVGSVFGFMCVRFRPDFGSIYVVVGFYLGFYVGCLFGFYVVCIWALFWFCLGFVRVRFAFDLAPIWVHFLVSTWGVLGFFVGSICVLFGCHFGLYVGFDLGSSWG